MDLKQIERAHHVMGGSKRLQLESAQVQSTSSAVVGLWVILTQYINHPILYIASHAIVKRGGTICEQAA